MTKELKYDPQGILLTEEVLNGSKILYESELPEGSKDLSLKIRTVQVRFADTERKYNYSTEINGTRKEITEHFNRPLNFGVEDDDIRTPVRLQFLPDDDSPDSITIIVPLLGGSMPRRFHDLRDSLQELVASHQLGPPSVEECGDICLILKMVDLMTTNCVCRQTLELKERGLNRKPPMK